MKNQNKFCGVFIAMAFFAAIEPAHVAVGQEGNSQPSLTNEPPTRNDLLREVPRANSPLNKETPPSNLYNTMPPSVPLGNNFSNTTATGNYISSNPIPAFPTTQPEAPSFPHLQPIVYHTAKTEMENGAPKTILEAQTRYRAPDGEWVSEDMAELVSQIWQAKEEYTKATDDELKAEARKKIIELTSQQYEKMHAERLKDLEELEQKLSEAKTNLEKRHAAKDKIIERRVEHLLGVDPIYQWDSPAAAPMMPSVGGAITPNEPYLSSSLTNQRISGPFYQATPAVNPALIPASDYSVRSVQQGSGTNDFGDSPRQLRAPENHGSN